jgi:hypothetical protein
VEAPGSLLGDAAADVWPDPASTAPAAGTASQAAASHDSHRMVSIAPQAWVLDIAADSPHSVVAHTLAAAARLVGAEARVTVNAVVGGGGGSPGPGQVRTVYARACYVCTAFIAYNVCTVCRVCSVGGAARACQCCEYAGVLVGCV